MQLHVALPHRSASRRRLVHAAVIAALLALAPRALAITFDYAQLFERQRWSLSDLGFSGGTPPPSGVVFSNDGAYMYLGISADNGGTSNLYRFTVTRSAGRVTGFTGRTQVFSVPDQLDDRTLDAGLLFDGNGRFFYSIYGPNILGERLVTGTSPPALGSERTYALGGILPTSVDGLALSPWRPADKLHASLGEFSSRIYELCLRDDPAAPGFLEPFRNAMPPCALTVFVEALGFDVGGLHYIPTGPFQGDLLYASTEEGTLRVIMIDPATGNPLDQTGQPELGTTTPLDSVVVSGLESAAGMAGGPVGLDFDPMPTGDVFLTTVNGNPANSLIQIGGWEVGGSTTTTTTIGATTTTTTSTTQAPTTTIATTTSTTTTTTSTTTTSTTSTTTTSTTTTLAPTTTTNPTTSTTTTTLAPTTTSTLATTTTTSSTTTSTPASTTTAPATTSTTTSTAPTTSTSAPTTSSTTTSTQAVTTTTSTTAPSSTTSSSTTSSTTSSTSATTSTTSSTTTSSLPATTTSSIPGSTTSSTSTSSSVPASTSTSTTSTTLPAPLCLPGECDDADACTDDRCDAAAGCLFTPKVGKAGVACLCEAGVPPACVDQAVPGRVSKRLTRACALVDRADVARAGRARRLLREAAALGRQGAKAAQRAGQAQKLTPACAEALRARLLELRTRSEALGAGLTPQR